MGKVPRMTLLGGREALVTLLSGGDGSVLKCVRFGSRGPVGDDGGGAGGDGTEQM